MSAIVSASVAPVVNMPALGRPNRLQWKARDVRVAHFRDRLSAAVAGTGRHSIKRGEQKDCKDSPQGVILLVGAAMRSKTPATLRLKFSTSRNTINGRASRPPEAR